MPDLKHLDEAQYLSLSYYKGRRECRNQQPFETKRGESSEDRDDRFIGWFDERDGVSVNDRLRAIKNGEQL